MMVRCIQERGEGWDRVEVRAIAFLKSDKRGEKGEEEVVGFEFLRGARSGG